MLSYKQIKRENHIIETAILNNEKFELYESNELGNDEFFTLVKAGTFLQMKI